MTFSKLKRNIKDWGGAKIYLVVEEVCGLAFETYLFHMPPIGLISSPFSQHIGWIKVAQSFLFVFHCETYIKHIPRNVYKITSFLLNFANYLTHYSK